MKVNDIRRFKKGLEGPVPHFIIVNIIDHKHTAKSVKIRYLHSCRTEMNTYAWIDYSSEPAELE